MSHTLESTTSLMSVTQTSGIAVGLSIRRHHVLVEKAPGDLQGVVGHPDLVLQGAETNSQEKQNKNTDSEDENYTVN